MPVDKRPTVALDLDITFIFVIALFLIPLVLLNFLVFRPFMAVFEQRHDKLEGAIERANAMLEEAEKSAEEFNEQIRAATKRGVERRNEIRRAATDAMNEKIERERKRIAERMEKAVEELAAKHEQASSQIQAQADALARETATKVLGRAL